MTTHTISSPRLDLVLLTAALIDELLRDSTKERESGGFLVPAAWPDDHDARFLRMRREQIAKSPADEPFLARAIVLPADPRRPMVGHIGFHQPPQHGALEMGYTVFPEHRRQGIAHEAALAMMAWATAEHGVRRYILSISPDNAPSLAMAEKLGFTRTGEQVDEEDGLEWVFELRLQEAYDST